MGNGPPQSLQTVLPSTFLSTGFAMDKKQMPMKDNGMKEHPPMPPEMQKRHAEMMQGGKHGMGVKKG